MPTPRKIKMAIAYDFDGTLSPGNMQNYDFIPALGIKPPQFWEEVKQNAETHDMDEILSYLELMLEKANRSGIPIRKKDFIQCGRKITLFPGVESWFPRINQYAEQSGIALEHYIISSGLREMIKGTPIGKYFKKIFASGYKYDQNKVAVWPAVAVNFTTKTQFLFRINKGIHNSYDNTKINQYQPEEQRPLPFRNLLYLGDGETDIPCMKMIKHQGGSAFAVYNEGKRTAKRKARELIKQNRVDFVFAANYAADSPLSKAVQEIIQKIAAENRLRRITN